MMRSTIKRFARNRPWSPHLSVENFNEVCENIHRALIAFVKSGGGGGGSGDDGELYGWAELCRRLLSKPFIITINHGKYDKKDIIIDHRVYVEPSYNEPGKSPTTAYFTFDRLHFGTKRGDYEYVIRICENKSLNKFPRIIVNYNFLTTLMNHELRHAIDYILSKHIEFSKPQHSNDISKKLPHLTKYPNINYLKYLNLPQEVNALIAELILLSRNHTSPYTSNSTEWIKFINQLMVEAFSDKVDNFTLPIEIYNNMLMLYFPKNRKKIIWEVYKAIGENNVV